MCDLALHLPPHLHPPVPPRLQTLLDTHALTTLDLLTLPLSALSRRLSPNASNTSNSRTPSKTPSKAPNHGTHSAHSNNPNARPPLDTLELQRYTAAVIAALQADASASAGGEGRGESVQGAGEPAQPQFITAGSAALDAALSGGVPTGAVTEFVGEAGAGKTQFLLTLCCTAQLLPRPSSAPHDPTPPPPPPSAVYITTEAPLATPRLAQIAATLGAPVSTDRVFAIACGDIETQDHIVRYQLPLLVQREGVVLVVLDSVAANYRVEYAHDGGGAGAGGQGASLAGRGGRLVELARQLRELARRYGVAVVVANQVGDNFEEERAGGNRWGDGDRDGGRGGDGDGGRRSKAEEDADVDVMALDYQARWFSGWDARRERDAKVPALGLVWANLLAARVVLKKGSGFGGGRGAEAVRGRREGEGVEYEFWEGGVRSVEEGAEWRRRNGVEEMGRPSLGIE
ncbi:P-loop containing nucleoside triphosphate hydrolase protein [Geopyxis carbonaria]|nr:P-loop containing nucleoside triphosphate hydrolase protein [Geopyxis carbonaria]